MPLHYSMIFGGDSPFYSLERIHKKDGCTIF